MMDDNEYKLLRSEVKSMKRLFKNKLRERDRALRLQRKEYKRRLAELNHENQRILQAQDRSVTVDKFEGVANQLNQKIDATKDDLRKDILELKEFKQKQEGKGQGSKEFMEIIRLIIVVLGFFLAYFIIKK